MKRRKNNLQNDYHLTTEDDPNDYLDDYLKDQRRIMKKTNWKYLFFAVLYYLSFLPAFYPIYRVLTHDGVPTALQDGSIMYGYRGVVTDLRWVLLFGGGFCLYYQFFFLLITVWKHKETIIFTLAIILVWIIAAHATEPIARNNRINKNIPSAVTEYLTYQYGAQDAANMDVLIIEKNCDIHTSYYEVISPTYGTFHVSYYCEPDDFRPPTKEIVKDDTNPNAYTIEHVTETTSDTVED